MSSSIRVRAVGVAVVALLTAGLTVACSSKSAAPPPKAVTGGSLDDLYTQAKADNHTVAFAGPTDASDIQPLLDDFMAKYPGVKVTYTNVTAANLTPQLAAQVAAKSVRIDLAQGSTQTLQALQQQNLMTGGIPWDKYGVTAPLLGGNDCAYWYDLPSVIIYNTNLVPKDQAPTSWQDLVSGRWKGQLALDSRGNFGMFFLTDPSQGGQQAGLDWAAQMKAQKPLLEARQNDVLRAVETGQVKVGNATAESVLLAIKQDHAPIAIAPVSPVAAAGYCLYVPTGAPGAAGATLLASYLLSQPALDKFSNDSTYGPVQPCTAGPLAQQMCDLNIKVFRNTDEQVINEAADYLGKFTKAMGATN